MKLLHVTPHLGGGVGKAHAALRGVLPPEIDQTFVLLEEPRDRRYVEALARGGARMITAESLTHVAHLASKADIVQFEFWNHPRLFECLARCALPPIRSVFWSHISGLSAPFVPPGLMEEAMRFVFTTVASFDAPSLAFLSEAGRNQLRAINSGFGFPGAERRIAGRDKKPVIAYLGTVDFAKMHPGFFEVIDNLADDDICMSVWGAVDLSGPAAARARAMRHPQRVVFHGHAADPAVVLSEADIFFYPLQPDHYGTAENALIEAMSLGLVPVVLNNAAETAIVRNGETGFVAQSIEECRGLLEMLLSSSELRARLSRNAIAYVAENRTAELSAREFIILWLGLLAKSPAHCDFGGVVGYTPADWFIATQCLPGTNIGPTQHDDVQLMSKGTLAHFESVFSGDESLVRLRAGSGI